MSNYIIGSPVAIDASAVTSGSFTANWEAPVDDTVTSYLLDVAYDEYFTNPLPGYEQLNVGNVLSDSITGLASSQIYYYRVRAIKEGVLNAGPYSNTIVVSTLPPPPEKLFVNAGATEGTKDGTSWENAFLKFEDALSSASFGDTIWVAKGVYQPGENMSFSLGNNVKIFGGFAGNETSLSQRVLTADNATVLNGNGSHIISSYYVSQSTEIDGFTIADGYYKGNDSPFPQSFKGLGIYNYRSFYTIRNCMFKNNKFDFSGFGIPGIYQGGAIYNEESSPVIINCIFEDNSSGDGGAITNFNSDPQIINSVFANNSARGAGGAIENLFSSKSVITGCVFYGNHTTSTGLGSVMYNYGNSDASFVNCTITKNFNAPFSQYTDLIVSVDGATASISNSIITKNDGIIDYVNASKITISYSLLDFGYEGENVTEADPMFNDINNPAGADGIWATSDDGLQLRTGSPAINAGNNDKLMISTTISTDIAGNVRIQNDTVDIGSYEYIDNVLPVTLVSFKAVSKGCAVQVNWKAAQETGIEKYTIEKSIDGIHFAGISEVTAKNTSGASYAYICNSNNESALFVRLKITGKNSTTDYSATEKVMLYCQQPNITMTPNPVKNILMVTNLSGTNGIQVYNTSGQRVVSLRTNNSRQPVDVASLPNGVYVVRVINNNKVLTTQKIMKY